MNAVVSISPPANHPADAGKDLIEEIADAIRPCLGDARTLAKTVIGVIARTHYLLSLQTDATRAALLTLKDSGAKLGTQDGQCTADPLFVVYQKRRIYGIDADYANEFAWVDTEDYNEATPQEAEELDHKKATNQPIDDQWVHTGYTDVDEFVTCCFTADAANAYIAANKHNLKRPHVYVDTLYRNTEMKAVRELLVALQ